MRFQRNLANTHVNKNQLIESPTYGYYSLKVFKPRDYGVNAINNHMKM